MDHFAERLLAWFGEHGRKDLPWQQDKQPYKVWVSEIMLQQTQVTTVIPYYERFMQVFPTVDELAAATQDEVLHQWTGLGYYARARNLHKTAQIVMRDFNGEFPGTQEELESLPGIGRSTAAAIIAICTNQRAAILDGNVKRVLARVFGIGGWPGQTATLKALWEKAELLTPDQRVADYTQAIMDLGAMICTRSKPQCNACPFSGECHAKNSDSIAQFPGKKPKKEKPVRATTMLVIECDGEILLEQRESSGLWGGLWSFPESDDPDSYLEAAGLDAHSRIPLTPFRHSFTHYHLDISPLHIHVKVPNRVSDSDRTCWYNLETPQSIGLTRPVTRLLDALQSSPLFQ
ncbi:MAG: A/G-specific adenine glycosylase [Pseudomonadales bacterium]|jgi:A/G-specific adenine glycosylase|nr:A/G-specific adenine glycosylase [Pseudomonadales bacterium]